MGAGFYFILFFLGGGQHYDYFDGFVRAAFWRKFWLTAARETYSAMSILGTNSGFALGPRKTTENFGRIGRSQDQQEAY